MESADFLDKDFSSEAEACSDSETGSTNNDFDGSFSDRQVLVNRTVKHNALRGHRLKHARARKGIQQAIISRRRTIRTRAGCRTAPLQ